MKILYFAWLRERLNRSEERADPPPSVATVADLIEWKSSGDEGFEYAFENRSLIKVAVNAVVADFDTPVGPDDVVAFFPYPTGG